MLCPKYRKLALNGNVSKYVSKLIYEIDERYDVMISELAVMPDYAHMFISTLPDIVTARLVQEVIYVRKVKTSFFSA